MFILFCNQVVPLAHMGYVGYPLWGCLLWFVVSVPTSIASSLMAPLHNWLFIQVDNTSGNTRVFLSTETTFHS